MGSNARSSGPLAKLDAWTFAHGQFYAYAFMPTLGSKEEWKNVHGRRLLGFSRSVAGVQPSPPTNAINERDPKHRLPTPRYPTAATTRINRVDC